ncbi:MAG TPA: regulatory protein RecX [Rhodanobacteraceae bacterium]|jgi:regulatory protein|nr:regulatory protein RecX [Rhodanobacteraceae bacterium]
MARRPSDKQNEPSAYEKALGLLSRREHSARELKAKLAQRGFDADENAAVLERLQSKDFQNDARFGEMLVRSRIEGGYGPRWIVAELRTHGIDEERAAALIAAAEPDWPSLVRRQLRRRYGSKPAASLAERSKRAAFLLRRGFDGSTVKLAVDASSIAGSPDEAD